MTFYLSFKEHIIGNKFVPATCHILAAVSGGIDSMVLVHILKRLGSEGHLTLSVAHVQHHLRKDAEEDAELVETFCMEHNIPYYRRDLNPLTKEKNECIEAWARRNRYQYFRELKRKIGAEIIATAHHGDDQIETILMHLADGTGLDGLIGIHEKINNTVRPLLHFTRMEIEQYAKDNHIPFREDSTNQDLSHPRNYLRKEIIPQWKYNIPHLASSFLHLSDNVNDTKEVLNYLINKSIPDYVEFDGQNKIIFKMENLKDEPLLFKVFLIKYLIGKKDQWRRHQWNNIKRFIQWAHTGDELSIGHATLLKDRERILIRTNKVQPDENVYSVRLGDQLINDHFEFTWTSARSLDIQTTDHDCEIIDAEKAGNDLQLRLWKNGDRFQPLGMKGHKKISDYLIDNKIDCFQKNSQYVLAKGHEVLWVCGQRISDQIKVTDETKRWAELSFQKMVG